MLAPLMTSRFSANITIQAGPRNRAIHDAVYADARYYEGPDNIRMHLGDAINVSVSADSITHLRAGVNSVLRLAAAADDSIKSISYNDTNH